IVFNGPIHLSQSYVRALFSNAGAAHRLARQFTATNRLAVVKLLDGAFQGIRAGDLLTPFVCMRSCLEQLAHFHHSQSAVRAGLQAVPDPPTFKAAVEAVDRIRAKLVEISYATRVDWMAVASDPTRVLRKREIKYRPTERRVDLTAKSIMDAVDALDEVVPGVRATYETLCEFAHPNVGTIFIFTNSCEMLPADGAGVNWI